MRNLLLLRKTPAEWFVSVGSFRINEPRRCFNLVILGVVPWMTAFRCRAMHLPKPRPKKVPMRKVTRRWRNQRRKWLNRSRKMYGENVELHHTLLGEGTQKWHSGGFGLTEAGHLGTVRQSTSYNHTPYEYLILSLLYYLTSKYC